MRLTASVGYTNLEFAMNRLAKLTALSIITLTMFCGHLSAQDKKDEKSELAVRQRLVERKMVELEARFTAAAERIREKDPKRADRLIKTYQKSKEQSLSKKMSNVSQLLDEGSFAEADKELDEVIQVLESMIRLLTNDKEKTVSKKEEIETLEKIKKEIQKRLEEQKEQTAENKKVGNKKQAIANLEAQIKQLQGLIKKQDDNIADTKSNVNAGLRKLDKIADKQFQIRKETEELAQAIRDQKMKKDDPGAKSDGESKKGDGKPGGGKSGKAGEPGEKKDPPKPGIKEDERLKELQKKKDDLEKKLNEEAKKGDGKKSDGKPGENKDGKPSEKKDGKPGAGKPSEGKSGKPGDGKSGEGKSGQKQKSKPQQPGSKSLDKAANKQRIAEEKLASGKPKDAARQQEEAKKELEEALKELKKEKRRLESLPPEALKQLADKQRRTRDKTMDILEELKKAPKSKDEKQGGDQKSKPNQAGQKPGEQAGGAMKKAAENLEKNDSKKAEEEQKKAEEKLEEAIEELEERLKQLREETNEEKLARLEARFTEMLTRQQVASIMTIELDDKRTNLGQIRRRDQLLILRLATEELQIHELGQQAYDLLVEDGTSVVFPEVVEDLKGDLVEAGELLQSEKTTQYTQLVQKEIETTIEDLIDALKEEQKKGGGGGGGGGGGKQPLLKKSAELKMLRMRQRRVNRRTMKIEEMRDNPDLAEILTKESDDAAEIQRKIIEMTERIMEDSQQ
jgi:hypothetical protein